MEGTHEHARRLMVERLLQALPESEGRFLEDHLSDCSVCRRFSVRLADSLHALRLPGVTADALLIARTRLRIQAHANERAEALRASRQLGGLLLLSVATAATSAWGLWLAADRLPFIADLPTAVKLVAAVTIWFVPGGIAAVAAGLRFTRPDGPALRRFDHEYAH